MMQNETGVVTTMMLSALEISMDSGANGWEGDFKLHSHLA